MSTTPPGSPTPPTRTTSLQPTGGADDQSQDQATSGIPVTGAGNTGDTPQTAGTTSPSVGLGRRNAVKRPNEPTSGQPQTTDGAETADPSKKAPPGVAARPDPSVVVAALANVPAPAVDRGVKPPEDGAGQSQTAAARAGTPPPDVDRTVKPAEAGAGQSQGAAAGSNTPPPVNRGVKPPDTGVGHPPADLPPPARPPKTFLAAVTTPYPTAERSVEQQAAAKGIGKVFMMLRTEPAKNFHPFMQKEGVFRLSAEKKALDKFVDKMTKDKDKKADKKEFPTLKELFQKFMSSVKGATAGTASKKEETKDPVLLAAALKNLMLSSLTNEEKTWFCEQAQKHATEQNPAPLPPLSMLPPFLQDIFELCAYVALNAEATKMTASNLGVCLGPNLAPELEVGTDPAAAMTQAMVQNSALVKLCEDYISQLVQAHTMT